MSKAIATPRQTNKFDGQVNVCVHYVDFRYWGFKAELTPELESLLEEHAEERAKECIIEGYHSGELNCCYLDDSGKEEEIRGWWEINSD